MKRSRAIGAAICITAIPIVLALMWAILHIFFPGMRWVRSYHLWYNSNLGVSAGLRWLLLFVEFTAAAAIVMWRTKETRMIPAETTYGRTSEVQYNDWRPNQTQAIVGGILTIIAVISLFQFVRVFWDNNKDAAKYYNQATTFVTPDINNPVPSLSDLTKGALTADGGKCDLVGKADVPSCIKQGTLSTEGWEPRVSSLDGATIVMTGTSGQKQGVNIDKATITYLNATKDGPTARWSAIRDGRGIDRHMEGVVEWTGTGLPTECSFTGKYTLNKALNGARSNALSNYIATKYPNLFFSLDDVWGYCNSGEPIVVIPVQKQAHFKNRTVNTAAGILIVRGSPNGKPNLTYQSTVKAGEYPGPVYPISLAARQRVATTWAAGREFRYRNKFGYEPANSEAQAGNNSEYLLRGAKDGRLYWITPLTLRGTKSETFVAYSIIPADEVTAGQLNPLTISTLTEHEPRNINIDNLEASARTFVSQTQPGFFPAGGKLIEFTPTDGDIWRGFAEQNGRVIYRLDISASNKIAPQLVQLQNPDIPNAAPGNALCGGTLAQLTPGDITNCLQQFVGELSRRQQAPSK